MAIAMDIEPDELITKVLAENSILLRGSSVEERMAAYEKRNPWLINLLVNTLEATK